MLTYDRALSLRIEEEKKENGKGRPGCPATVLMVIYNLFFYRQKKTMRSNDISTETKIITRVSKR